MKKLIKQLIPACFLFLGVFASCTSENEPDSPVSASGISLRLQTSAGSTRSSVDTGTDLENQIHNIHLWFFASGASDTDKALFYTSELPTSASRELVLSYTDEVLRLHNMHSEGSYELLVVANLPADATTIGEATTLNELKNYVYSAASSGRPHNPYTMTGSTTGAHDFSIDSQVSIPLLRVASRLDVKIINATGKTLQVDKVSIVNDQQSVQLFAPASGTPAPASNPFEAAADIYTTSITADKVECSGYVYENRSTTSTDVVIEGSVDGNAAKWTVPITPDGSAILPRNSICKATINLKGITPTDVEFNILNWDDKNVNAPIYGAYLTVLEKIVSVSPANGGLLHVHTNSASIQVNWENASHVYLEGYRGENSAEVPVVNDVALLRFNLLEGESSNFNEKISINASGLKSEVTLQRKDVGYVFNVKKIVVANSGYTLSHGMIVPADFYTGQTGLAKFPIIIERNVPWFAKISYYKVSDGTQAMASNTQTFTYDGTPGEISEQINVRANLTYEDVKVVMELGVGLVSSGFTTYTVEFMMRAKS
ncbi:hypothetical protein [uncultured Bacteroides sp.]|uniref:hypothetical protein n=1 Tax=uncultured Bacteroides sp. TaxID=162156 RepID=UPI0025D30F45|nr:hypothetical protein [uncultured Bacteroides sp.]